jgi:hypothetical protein
MNSMKSKTALSFGSFWRQTSGRGVCELNFVFETTFRNDVKHLKQENLLTRTRFDEVLDLEVPQTTKPGPSEAQNDAEDYWFTSNTASRPTDRFVLVEPSAR